MATASLVMGGGSKSAALSASVGVSPSAPDPTQAAGFSQLLGQAQQRAAASIASPSAIAASRTKYANESASAAVGTDQAAFPDQVGAAGFQSLDLGVRGRVVQKLSENEVAVVDPSGHRAVAVGALPLYGTRADGSSAPLDLRLADGADSFSPQSALSPVSLPKSSDGAVAFQKGNFDLRFGSGSPVDAVRSGDTLVYPNLGAVGSDVDAVLRPVAVGADISFVLRSAASPEALTLSFDLQPGWKLKDPQDGSGTIQVVDASGSPTGVVLPVVASDATGQSVPASYQVADDTHLVVHVSHKGGSFSYPVIVDPVVNTDDWSGTSIYSSWTHAVYPGFSLGTYGSFSGLRGTSNYNYGSGGFAEYYQSAPAGAYIDMLVESGVYHGVNSSQEFGGIWNWGASNWETGTYTQGGTTKTPAGRYNGLSESNATVQYCARAGCGSGSITNNAAIFGLYASGHTSTAAAPFALIADATLYEADNYTPQVTSVQHSPGYVVGKWVKDSTDTVTMTSWSSNPHNQGLGLLLNELQINPPGESQILKFDPVPCTGTHLPSCPFTRTSTFTLDTSAAGLNLPEGTSNVSAAAGSASGNGSSPSADGSQWAINIDRTPPAVSATLLDPSGHAVSNNANVGGGNDTLQVNATDSSSSHSTSGVTSIAIAVDGTTVASPQQSCAAGGCSMSTSWTLNPGSYSAGSHTITVTATDQAGNTSQLQTITFNVLAATTISYSYDQNGRLTSVTYP